MMNFNLEIPCEEVKIQQTIAVSRQAFLAGEGERSVSYGEFLYQQSRFVKKQWWLLQGALLLAVCLLLRRLDTGLEIRRSLGVAAPLFVILLLPELWKNRGNDAMEVEGTTLYTLRQVYAARMTLFAGMDLLLLTLFFWGAARLAQITLWEMLIQFLLPGNVACCICLGSLYGGKNQSEALSILLCSVWCGVWLAVVSDERVYGAISLPLWAGLLATSFAYLVSCVVRGQKTIFKTWEASASWN